MNRAIQTQLISVSAALVCLLIAFTAVGTLAQGSGVPATQTNSPREKRYRVLEAVPFLKEGDVALAADFYIPDGMGPFPAILLIHGGGWRDGNRKQLRRQAAFMAQRGTVGMAIDYRLAPANPYPAAVADSRSALAFLRSHASTYKVDANHIALMGSSAGAHLAALVATTVGAEGNPDPPQVQAVVAFNGIFDFAAMPPSTMVSDFLGAPCDARLSVCADASPIDHVRAGLPPMLILHGTADKTAPYEQASAFVSKLKAAGDSAEMFTAPGAPHTFWAQPRWLAPTFEAMCVFLKHTLQPNQPSANVCTSSASERNAAAGDR